MSVSDPITDRARAVSILAAMATIVPVGLGLSLTIPLLAFELEARGIPAGWIGLNTAMAGIASIVAAPLVPGLVQRFGARPVMLAASLIGALTLVGFKLAAAFWLWFPLRFVTGAAMCALWVVSEAWINAAAPPARRGLVMGIYSTLLAGGFAVGPALLAAIGASGWLPYLAGSALMAVATVSVAMAGRLVPRFQAEPDAPAGVLRFLRAAPAATLAALVFGAVETGEMSFLPLYGMRLGFDEAGAALLLTAAMLGSFAFQVPLGWLSDRMDRRLVLAGCGAVGALGALALAFGPATPAAILAAAFVTGGVAAALYTVGLAHLGARFRGADLAAANAAFIMLYAIGFTFGPPLLGEAMEAWPPHGFAVGLAAMLGVYALVVALRRILVPRDA